MLSYSEYLDIITNLISNVVFFNRMHIYKSLLSDVIQYGTDVAGVARAPAMLLPTVRVSHVRFISFNTCVL